MYCLRIRERRSDIKRFIKGLGEILGVIYILGFGGSIITFGILYACGVYWNSFIWILVVGSGIFWAFFIIAGLYKLVSYLRLRKGGKELEKTK